MKGLTLLELGNLVEILVGLSRVALEDLVDVVVESLFGALQARVSGVGGGA